MAALTLTLSAANQVLTIDKAIKLALKHSPDIDISRLDFQGAKERSRFQRGYYLPSINLNTTAGKMGFEYESQENLSGNTLMGTLSASQLLYDFGKTRGRVTAADEEAKAQEASMNQHLSKKIFEIKARYYDVLKIQSIIEVNKKNIALQEEQLRSATRYYETGVKTIVDVTDAQVRLTQAKLQLNDSEYELKLRRATLEQTMGYIPYNGAYDLHQNKLDLPNVSKLLPKITTTLRELEGFAYDHRYELQSSKYMMASSQAKVVSEKGDYLPTIGLKGDYQAQKVDKEFAALTPKREWQAGVGLEWNLFSGHQTDTSVQEAKINAMKAASRLEEVRLQIRQQVTQSYLDLKRTRDTILLSESIAKASAEKFYQAQKQYENDLADYLQLQEAQQGYINSLGDLVNAYYDFYIAIAQLDFAIGK